MTEGAIQTAEALRERPPIPATFPASLRLTASPSWRLTQLVVDFATVFVAATASYWIYVKSGLGTSHWSPDFYLGLHLGLAVITVFALHGQGAYRGQFGLLRIESVRRVLSAVFWGVAILLVLSFFLHLPWFSRLSVLVLGPSVGVALVAQRFALWRLQERLRVRRGRVAPVLIYGAGETGRLIAQNLLGDHALGMRAVGFLDDRRELLGESVRVGAGVKGERLTVFGGEADVVSVFRATGASAVVLAMPSASSERIGELVARLESDGIPFFCVPSAGSLFFSTLKFGQLGGIPVFSRRRVEAERFYDLSKRLIDVAVSALVLLLAAPAIGVAALLVKLTSPGPVLFRQKRIGLHGRPFTIYKLRTMRKDVPKYGFHPESEGDPRVTGVGKWLRRLSIDELPQLVNVLRGTMSLVGPRPEMPFIAAEYGDIERQRLTVKPGVTGLWQISADRAFLIHHNIQYDLYYVENRSLGLDLAILMMTPFVALMRERAR